MSAAGLPDYWPWMVAYHHVREPLYRTIIGDLQLSPAARILDAGAGDTYYSQLLSRLLGPAAQIVAVDNHLRLLGAMPNSPPNVQRCLSDLDHLGLAPGCFDAVWFCRSMHSAPDPLARLAALLPMLRPGGQLIVIENDTAHHPILPFPADFEQRLRQARLHYERTRCDSAACERYRAATHLSRWLVHLGLSGVSAHTYVSEDLAPLSPEVEAYWQKYLAWDANHLEPYLSPADAKRYCAAHDPSSPDYLLSQPGCYLVELTTVAIGHPVHAPEKVVLPRAG